MQRITIIIALAISTTVSVYAAVPTTINPAIQTVVDKDPAIQASYNAYEKHPKIPDMMNCHKVI